MTKVLLIHGINNQGKSRDIIRESWAASIQEAATAAGVRVPTNTEFIAAFYGDVLHEETESWSKNKRSATKMGVDSPDSEYVDDAVAALYIEYQHVLGISDEQVAQELDPGEDMLEATRMAKGIHKKWLKAIARALEKVLPKRGKAVSRQFLQQAAAYLQKPGLKGKINRIVEEQLFDGIARNEEVVVIGHSLGSVIAYDLLRSWREDIQVGLLMTCGSPLGVEVVKVGIGPPLVCLSNVRNWLNVSDPEDFVALRPKLTKKTFGCDSIDNIANVDNGYENAHDILKYLSHAEVVKKLIGHL